VKWNDSSTVLPFPGREVLIELRIVNSHRFAVATIDWVDGFARWSYGPYQWRDTDVLRWAAIEPKPE
jgi:hypothetical protein